MNTPPSSLEDLLASLARLSDRQVLEQVGRMARDERNATARLIAFLAEVDRRRLYRDAGCSSLFGFCTDVLGLSESEAYLRIEAARAARKFPLVFERLAEGSITLTAASKLARHLTEENHRALLDAVRHASKREIDEILASLCPRPDAKEMVRRLPERAARAAPVAPMVAQPRDRADERVSTPISGVDGLARDHPDENRRPRSGEGRPSRSEEPAETPLFREPRPPAQNEAEEQAKGRSARPPLAPAARPAAIAAQPRNSVLALAPQRYRVQLTIGAGTNEKLRRARDLLRHEIPDGDLAEIFDRALTRLVAELEKKRFAATPHRKAKRPSTRGGHFRSPAVLLRPPCRPRSWQTVRGMRSRSPSRDQRLDRRRSPPTTARSRSRRPGQGERHARPPPQARPDRPSQPWSRPRRLPDPGHRTMRRWRPAGARATSRPR